MNRFEINIARQFVIFPTIGVTWGAWKYKWAIAFAWLNIQCRFAFGREHYDE